MAKKPSSKAKNSKRAVDNSAVKGGGLMSINKSNTSPGMKIVLIILIVSFVLLFSYGGITGFIDLFTKQPQTTTAAIDPITQIKNTYDPQIAAFNKAIASNPASYTLLVNLGNSEYSYAQALAQASQTTTSATVSAVQHWALARAAFEKAAKVHKLDQNVLVDYSVTQFYSAQTTDAVTAAIGTALTATKRFPTFAPAYFNLGIFYEAIKQNAFAVSAFQRYIVLDPKGIAGNPGYAVQQLKTLGGSVPSTATPAPAPSGASSATTP